MSKAGVGSWSVGCGCKEVNPVATLITFTRQDERVLANPSTRTTTIMSEERTITPQEEADRVCLCNDIHNITHLIHFILSDPPQAACKTYNFKPKSSCFLCTNYTRTSKTKTKACSPTAIDTCSSSWTFGN